MKPFIERVILIPKVNRKRKPELHFNKTFGVTDIQQWLLDNHIDCSVYTPRINIDDRQTLFVVLGGDGTMLHAAREAATYPNVSIVGFNTGDLGFLTEELPNTPNDLKELLNNIIFQKEDKIKKDIRTLLVAYTDHHEPFYAFNEFLVTTSKAMNAPAQYNITINGQLLQETRSSGVIVSTATGSTAFAMSVGGAIIHPSAHVMEVVAVAPHSLTSRPVVLAGEDDVVEINVPTHNASVMQLIGDGQLYEESSFSPYTVQIRKVGRRVTIWRPADWNFFNVLSTKLGWK